MVTMKMRAAIVVTGVIAALFGATAPAGADPTDDPCQLAVTFLCRFLPIAPDLDHDVDLTRQQPPADPNAPPPESLPVVDPCAAGCI